MEKKTGRVPRLRFPEFRHDRPWSDTVFTKLYSFKRTNSLSRDKLNYNAGEIKNIHYGDIHTKFKPLFRLVEEHVPYVNQDVPASEFDDNTFCQEGDIVLADASENLDDVGKAIEVVSLDGERVVAGTHTILATRRGNLPIIGFGGQLFQSAAVRDGIKNEAQGSKIYGISAKRVSALSIPVPPSENEQRKIASCFSSLDDLITAQEKKLAALREYKKGLLQQLFPQPGETVPRLRFPEFRDAGEWVKLNIEKVAELKNGYAFKSDNYVEKGHYQIVTIGNVQQGQLNIDEIKSIITLPPDIQNHQILEIDDILLSMTGNVGRVCMVPTTGLLLNQRVGKIIPHSIDHKFFYQLLNRNEFLITMQQSAVGGAQGNINASTIKSFVFFCPGNLKEQQKIASCLSSLDALITAQEDKLASLREHKKGLMQQLFPNLETL